VVAKVITCEIDTLRKSLDRPELLSCDVADMVSRNRFKTSREARLDGGRQSYVGRLKLHKICANRGGDMLDVRHRSLAGPGD
jgi:hypothetical protein